MKHDLRLPCLLLLLACLLSWLRTPLNKYSGLWLAFSDGGTTVDLGFAGLFFLFILLSVWCVFKPKMTFWLGCTAICVCSLFLNYLIVLRMRTP